MRGAALVLVLGVAMPPSAFAEPAAVRSSASACAGGRSTTDGSITVCPAAAPVGAVVRVFGRGCHTPGSRTVLAVFLGPRAWVGSAGGGVSIDIPVVQDRFSVAFRIPATYQAGGDTRRLVPVVPGSGYAFAVYPAAECLVDFTVVDAAPPLASTGPPVVLLGWIALGLTMIGVVVLWCERRSLRRSIPRSTAV